MPVNEVRPIFEQKLCKCLASKHFCGKRACAANDHYIFSMFEGLRLYEPYIF